MAPVFECLKSTPFEPLKKSTNSNPFCEIFVLSFSRVTSFEVFFLLVIERHAVLTRHLLHRKWCEAQIARYVNLGTNIKYRK